MIPGHRERLSKNEVYRLEGGLGDSDADHYAAKAISRCG